MVSLIFQYKSDILEGPIGPSFFIFAVSSNLLTRGCQARINDVATPEPGWTD